MWAQEFIWQAQLLQISSRMANRRNYARRAELADETSDEESMEKYEVEYSVKSLAGSWQDDRASSYEVSVDENSKVTIRTRRPRGEIIVTTGMSERLIWRGIVGLSNSTTINRHYKRPRRMPSPIRYGTESSPHVRKIVATRRDISRPVSLEVWYARSQGELFGRDRALVQKLTY